VEHGGNEGVPTCVGMTQKKEKEGKMKKRVLFIICALFVCCTVRADNVITSLEYVKNQTEGNEQLGIVGLLDKDQIPAKNTDTVLMHTGVSGTVGEKGIYNTSASYASQTDNLVTAGTFNTAVQNALDTEFVCIESNNQGCLLYQIVSQSPNVLPIPENQTQTVDGVTITVNNGVYSFSGQGTTGTEICFKLRDTYKFPKSLDGGGTAVWYMFNNVSKPVYIKWRDAEHNQIDYWNLSPANRIVTSWQNQLNKTAAYVCYRLHDDVDLDGFTVAPMIVENGVTTYQRYIVPKPKHYLPDSN
jgi:hypothetical protein